MTKEKFTLIAGPCMAENEKMLHEVAAPLADLAKSLDVEFYFKASFDKANRTSPDSYRGPGWDEAKSWFLKLKKEYGFKMLTDVHETNQIKSVSEVCEGIQIPAFLCRQTDLLVEAAKHAQFLNIKKGQFLAPEAMEHIVHKTSGIISKDNVAVCERGTTFGYGDLVVDMRGLKTMNSFCDNVIFDVTHSTQKPASASKTSGGSKDMAPSLARAAIATGHVNGAFLEIHPNPKNALSDAGTQLGLKQGQNLIKQLHDIWTLSKSWKKQDSIDEV